MHPIRRACPRASRCAASAGRRPGRRQIHDRPVSARARRREHQEQRRLDREGAGSTRIPTSPIASRAREAAERPRCSTPRARLQGRFALQTMCCSACRSRSSTRWSYANGDDPAAQAHVAARAERQRPSADRLVDVRPAGISGDHGAGGLHDQVWDRVRDGDGTRLVGPMAARLPVGVDFIARPFDEAMLFRIASAYEAATRHRKPPPDFGPLAGEP